MIAEEYSLEQNIWCFFCLFQCAIEYLQKIIQGWSVRSVMVNNFPANKPSTEKMADPYVRCDKGINLTDAFSPVPSCSYLNLLF